MVLSSSCINIKCVVTDFIRHYLKLAFCEEKYSRKIWPNLITIRENDKIVDEHKGFISGKWLGKKYSWGKGSFFLSPLKVEYCSSLQSILRGGLFCAIKGHSGVGRKFLVEQVLAMILAILVTVSATLSLDFQQGLILTGRQLVDDSKFICLLGLCHAKFKVLYIFYHRFLNIPFHEKLKRTEKLLLFYILKWLSSLPTIFTCVMFFSP